MDGSPKIELRSGRAATETSVTVTAQMYREVLVLRTAAAMDRARATQTRTTAGRGHEAQQIQYLLDGDLPAKEPQIDSRHGAPGSMRIADVGNLSEQRRAQVITLPVRETSSLL